MVRPRENTSKLRHSEGRKTLFEIGFCKNIIRKSYSTDLLRKILRKVY